MIDPAVTAVPKNQGSMVEGSPQIVGARRPRNSQAVTAYGAANKVRTPEEREAEILRHLPLVQTVVDRLAATLPSSVDRDDLMSAGVMGLMEAVERFDAQRDNAFSTYAVLRIRGAVIDELRARDWVPRSARERAREYRRAVTDLSAKLGRSPHDAELANAMGCSEADLPDIERSAHLCTQVSLDEPVGDDTALSALLASSDGDAENPARNLEADDLRRLLIQALMQLSEHDRLVIKLYYFEHLLLREIAEILNVTESRVCQIHGRVVATLRARLAQHA